MAGPRSIPVEHIKAIVARHFKISVMSLESAARTNDMIKPRFIAIALCKELTKLSLPQIARRFGNRDHTTILHAIREVKRRYQLEYELLLEIVKASYAAYNDDRENGGQLLFWMMLFAWQDVNKRPGEKLSVIAATLGRPDCQVSWRREFLRLPPRTRILDMQEAQSLSDLWSSGWSVIEIAKVMGVTPASINSKIKRVRRIAPELFAYRFPRKVA